MFNFYLIFNIFDKKILIREHKEDLYLLFLSIILIILYILIIIVDLI